MKRSTIAKAAVLPTIPRALAQALRNGRVVLFVGSGLSLRAISVRDGNRSNVTWRRLLVRLSEMLSSDEHVDDFDFTKNVNSLTEKDHVDDLLILANYLFGFARKSSFDVPNAMDKILNEFNPDESHKLITQLNIAGIITTNFDNYIERAFSGEGKYLDAVGINISGSASAILNSSNPWFMRIHGRVGYSDSFVLSYDQYQEAYSSGTIKTALSVLMPTHTFVFLGFGFRDPPIMTIIRDITKTLGFAAGTHYLIGKQEEFPPAKVAFLQEKFHIRSLLYDRKTKDDDHAGIIDWLTAMRDVSNKSYDEFSQVLFVIRHPHDGQRILMQETDDPFSPGFKTLLFPSGRFTLPLGRLSRPRRQELLNTALYRTGQGPGLVESNVELHPLDGPFESRRKDINNVSGMEINFLFQAIAMSLKRENLKSLPPNLKALFDAKNIDRIFAQQNSCVRWVKIDDLINRDDTVYSNYNEDVILRVLKLANLA